MNVFTRQKEKRNNIDFFTGNTLKFLVKVDEKGRIIIPSDIRKMIGINFNDEIVLESSLRKNYVILYKIVNDAPKVCLKLNGYDGVIGSTKGCGPFSLGSNPGRSLKKRIGGKNGEL